MSYPPYNGYTPGYNFPPGYGYPPAPQHPPQQQSRYDPPLYQVPSQTTYNQNGQHWQNDFQNQYPVNGHSRSAPGYHQYSIPQPPRQQIQHVQPQQPPSITPPQTISQPIPRPEPVQQYEQLPAITPNVTLQTISPAYINPSAMTPLPQSNPTPDMSSLLIALAEEYFTAAHQIGPSIALSMTETETDVYGELISTGLGCLAIALTRVKLAPRVEAKIRLRYAGVLLEETENNREAEAILSHGISLCERNRYFDLKYAMQFLLARFMATNTPKAAIKALDSHATEAQTYQHFSWVYAFRFLRAWDSLQYGAYVDFNGALQSLRAIESLALQQQDHAIYMAASLVEAITYMKSTAPDAAQNIQAALAKAWTYQLDIGNATQLVGIAHFIQVAHSIRLGIPSDMHHKLKDMQTMMDAALADESWSMANDAIALPINRTSRSSITVSQDTRTVLGIGEDGRDNLMFSFLNAKDAYAINYLLCGMVNFQRSSQDQKAMAFFQEGLKMLEGSTYRPVDNPGVLAHVLLENQWRGQVICYLCAYLAFLAAVTGDWASTKQNLAKLEVTAQEFQFALDGPLESITSYLKAIHMQGTGNFDAALSIYESKKFDMSGNRSTTVTTADVLKRDISILAALNRLSILQIDRRKDPNANTAILQALGPHCLSHPNKDIQTVYHLLLATTKTNPEAQIFEIKKSLKAALNGAQMTANQQFTSITLSVMCDKFFKNVVGPQAEKSAQAASATANKTANPLWKSVAEGMLGKCYVVQGKVVEGQERLQVAKQLAKQALSES